MISAGGAVLLSHLVSESARAGLAGLETLVGIPGTVGGAILCGGKASRFGGKPKGLITLPDGQTIIGRMLDEFEKAGIAHTVLLSGDSKD